MNWIKLGKALLFPHIAIMLILLPLSTLLIVYSMVFVGTNSIIAIVSYVLSAYTLTIWCAKLPWLIRFFKNVKAENKYVQLWLNDTRLRVIITLYSSLIWNTAYAVFQLALGIFHSSFWFHSMAAYYLVLAIMRFFLVRHSSKNKPGEKMLEELVKYRRCGWILLLMNLAVSLMIFFMVYWNRTFNHHEITTIAMAAYTFTAFTMAIINTIKYRKYNSPVYSASKAISLASASVSVLTLESTMLTTFGNETLDLFTRKILLGATGAAISVFIIIMAIYMITISSKKLKTINEVKTNGK